MENIVHISQDFDDLEFIQSKKNGPIYVEVSVEEIKDLKMFGERLVKLAAIGFQYIWTTYDLGYYDSVDNKRMELRWDKPDPTKYTVLHKKQWA